jgi:hypothetical protein
MARQRIQCADGFSVSIQASAGHYCEPRIDNAKSYTHVELGYPKQNPPDYIKEYVEWCVDSEPPYTNCVYPHVPAELVDRMINEHGGIVDGECPPLDLESADDDDDNDDIDDIDTCTHILSITVSKGVWGVYSAAIRYLDDTNNVCEEIKSSTRLPSLLRDLANIVEELG